MNIAKFIKKCFLTLYHRLHKTLHLERAKAPGFNDRKGGYISNIAPFAIVESRELSRVLNAKFHAVCGIIFLSFFFFIPLSAGHKKPKTYQLAVCAIFQNEAPYLKEWIEFHRLAGVEHFYLYDNLSSDKYYKILKPYIKKKIVELVKWNYKTNADGGNWPTIQNGAYNDAINRARGKAKWVAFIDTDEFIFPVNGKDLASLLKQYENENIGAVCANWQMYGTSNVKKIGRKKLLINKLIYKAPTDYYENVHVKSIVRPERVVQCVTPHYFMLLPEYLQVDTDKIPFVGSISDTVKVDTIRINHYWTRDEFFFINEKLARRQKWQDGYILERANNLNQVEDRSIIKYAKKLKSKMHFK